MEQVTLLVEGFSITVAIWFLDFLCSIPLFVCSSGLLCCAHSDLPICETISLRRASLWTIFDPVHHLSHCNKDSFGPLHLPICGEYAKGSLGESQLRVNQWLITNEYASSEFYGAERDARLILATLAILARWRSAPHDSIRSLQLFW